MSANPDPVIKMFQAGVLAWILPGAGHVFLGQRGIGAILFVAISVPYLAGVAIGGVKESVNPQVNGWLYVAELGVGGYTSAFTLVSRRIPTMRPDEPSPYVAYYPETDVSQIYLTVAGLLNVLAVLDALSRAQTGGLPVFHHEMAAAERKAGAGMNALFSLAIVFIHPMKLPPGGRLWMFLPLALCIAVVYRATRARTPREIPRPAFFAFVNIVVGMSAIAVAFYAAHMLVLRYG